VLLLIDLNILDKKTSQVLLYGILIELLNIITAHQMLQENISRANFV